MSAPDLALAMRFYQAGELGQAEQVCRQILQQNSAHADVWHLLGVIDLQQRRFDQAIEYIRRALSLNPDDAAQMHVNLGVAYKSRGRADEALASYRQALLLRPAYAEAHFNLGLLLLEQKKLEAAAAAFRQAIGLKPGYAAAYNSLGQLLQEQGRRDEAVAAFRKALQIRPSLAEAHVNLGNAWRAQKKLDEAAASYEEALRLKPDLADAHNNLGCVLQEQRRLDDAVPRFREALRLKPDYLEAHNNLGIVLQALGKPAEAKACFESALRLQPSFASAHCYLGTIVEAEGQIDRARQCFESAVQHDPKMGAAHFNLGRLATKQRKVVQAEESFRRAVELQPANAAAHEALGIVLAGQGAWAESLQNLTRADQLEPADGRKLRIAMLLPVVLESLDEMREHRRRLLDGIARLLGKDLRIRDPLALGTLDFYLAYHGLNERSIRADTARLYLKACPELDYTAPHCRSASRPSARGPIKIGIVSQHLRQHTIGRLNAGLIQQLDRAKFHVTVIRQEKQDDGFTRLIDKAAGQVLVSPKAESLQAAQQLIASQELDVLFYPDIGMEPWTYLLAFARLARVQCVTWGHPLTTGIPNMDYFISSEDLETTGADDHYTEQLMCLPHLAVYYHRPALPQPPKDRSHFALPAGAHLYGCLQSMFKFHPEFDPILAEILRRDPAGLILLMSGMRSRWNELLLKRFQNSMPDVVERIRFLPPQSHPDFLSLTAICDVMLDPIHFGGGNTSYEALGLGVPVVTLPSDFLRGRITLAQYRQMNMLDCVAANAQKYVDLAVRLGTDAAFRAQVSAKINEASGVLYENDAGVRELEEFLIKAVNEPSSCLKAKPAPKAKVKKAKRKSTRKE